MPMKGEQTRETILSHAEALILTNGYSGTSIDEIINQSGITKGGFFYHFDGKNDLAKHLMLRYLEQDAIFFNGLFDRARDLTDDPLQQMLIFVKLLAESMEALPETHPGCLVASFTYECNQVDEEVSRLTAEGLVSWRDLFTDQLVQVCEKYAMNADVTIDDIADMLTSIIEGGIIMSRALDDKHILPKQILLFRNYLSLLFSAK